MLKQTFDDLLLDLRKRRQLGEPPPVVLLGAGASVESGVEAMDGLFKQVRCKDFAEFCRYIEKRTDAERYRLLADYLQTRAPEEISPGYQALASLCAAAFLDLVLTTNLDPLLDDSLAAADLWRRDYILLVNGVIRSDRVRPLLGSRSPRVKVLKLHGDLFHRFMAWTPAEMDAYLTDLGPQLAPTLYGRDVLVVGHSLRDERIRELVLGTGGAIWYTHPETAPPYLEAEDRVRAVLGAECRFEHLFPALAAGLGVAAAAAAEAGAYAAAPEAYAALAEVETTWRGLPAMPAAPAARTVDDLMAAVVGVAPPGAAPVLTGFLLADPRLVITDSWAARQSVRDGRLDLVSHRGGRFTTTVRQEVAEHPFGPLVLDAPGDWNVPGLRLAPALPGAGAAIQVGVAAGEGIGLSSGTVKSGHEDRVPIAPIGEVRHLLELACPTAPGASGAPVVDAGLAVRGFIVAGSPGADVPLSFMYPAYRWAAALGGGG
jgi:SIR2-like domain